jgi:hypothetical protein
MLRETDVVEAGFRATQVPVLADAYARALGVVERIGPVNEGLKVRLVEAVFAEARRREKLGLGLRHPSHAAMVAAMAAGFLFHHTAP